LRSLLIALWREIPAEENGFLNNIMQAISASDPSEGYRTTLVRWLEKRVTVMIDDALPAARRRRLSKVRLAHVLIMAFDGFAIDYHLHPRRRPRADHGVRRFRDRLSPASAAPQHRRSHDRRADRDAAGRWRRLNAVTDPPTLEEDEPRCVRTMKGEFKRWR